MPTKHWIANAIAALQERLQPGPHESNEIDWKLSLSENSARLAEHLIAFSNCGKGRNLAIGIAQGGAQLQELSQEATSVA